MQRTLFVNAFKSASLCLGSLVCLLILLLEPEPGDVPLSFDEVYLIGSNIFITCGVVMKMVRFN